MSVYSKSLLFLTLLIGMGTATWQNQLEGEHADLGFGYFLTYKNVRNFFWEEPKTVIFSMIYPTFWNKNSYRNVEKCLFNLKMKYISVEKFEKISTTA